MDIQSGQAAAALFHQKSHQNIWLNSQSAQQPKSLLREGLTSLQKGLNLSKVANKASGLALSDPALSGKTTLKTLDETSCKQLNNWHKYAELSKYAYHPDGDSRNNLDDGQWQSLNADKLGVDPELLKQDSYYATVLQHQKTGERVLVFRGADDAGDYSAGFKQGLGFSSDQFKQAVKLAKQLKQSPDNQGITVTGHSLGGGLAALAALEMDTQAVTFNALHLNPQVIKNNGLSSADRFDNKVINLTVDGDLLNSLQNKADRFFNTPKSGTRQMTLPAPDQQWMEQHSRYTPFDWINQSALIRSGTLHKIDTVIESLDQQQNSRPCQL